MRQQKTVVVGLGCRGATNAEPLALGGAVAFGETAKSPRKVAPLTGNAAWDGDGDRGGDSLEPDGNRVDW